jgi:adenylate cyclase
MAAFKHWSFTRLGLAAVLILICIASAFMSRELPVLGGTEKAIHDLYRFNLAPETAQDPDITVLLYDDTVARSSGRTTPVDRTMLAQAVRSVSAANARAIVIDMIFIQPTDDEEVILTALSETRIPIFVAFADPEGDRASYWDESIAEEARAYQADFWKRIDNPLVTAVSPALGVDASGIARTWPKLGSKSNIPLAAAPVGNGGIARGYSGSIAFSKLRQEELGQGLRLATDMFPTLPLDAVTDPGLAAYFSDILDGRIVLIGSDTFNLDQVSTPITRMAGESSVPGVTVHAHMMRQALDENFSNALPWWSVTGLTMLFLILGGLTALIDRRAWALVLAGLSQFALLLLAPLLLHSLGYDILSVPILGLAIGWLTAFLAIGYLMRLRTSEERAFARNALGKYLPESVASEILDQPEKLSLEGEERELCIMFTDLEGFTKFSHGRPAPATARVLNLYLEKMSQIVLDHQGTIDKYVGDAIVAFWGAPISHEDDAQNCVKCALALNDASEELRRELADSGDSLGRTRIGLHYGEAVVGNFGGKRRIQYTALGDAMNIAARLEGANKHLSSAILASEEVVQQAPEFEWRNLGRIGLSGVASAISVYEPFNDDRSIYLSRYETAMNDISNGNAAGFEELQSLAIQYPEDQTLVAVARRAETIANGGVFVLGSK